MLRGRCICFRLILLQHCCSATDVAVAVVDAIGDATLARVMDAGCCNRNSGIGLSAAIVVVGAVVIVVVASATLTTVCATEVDNVVETFKMLTGGRLAKVGGAASSVDVQSLWLWIGSYDGRCSSIGALLATADDDAVGADGLVLAVTSTTFSFLSLLSLLSFLSFSLRSSCARFSASASFSSPVRSICIELFSTIMQSTSSSL